MWPTGEVEGDMEARRDGPSSDRCRCGPARSYSRPCFLCGSGRLRRTPVEPQGGRPWDRSGVGVGGGKTVEVVVVVVVKVKKGDQRPFP